MNGYVSGFCGNGQGHASCKVTHRSYGITPARVCTCPCHRLPDLIEEIGVIEVVEILEAQ